MDADASGCYRTIVETADESIWVIDSAGITTFANERLGEILGCPVAQMIGMPLFDFLDDGARQVASVSLGRRREGVNEPWRNLDDIQEMRSHPGTPTEIGKLMVLCEEGRPARFEWSPPHDLAGRGAPLRQIYRNDWQQAYRSPRPKVERKIAHFVRVAWDGRKARTRGWRLPDRRVGAPLRSPAQSGPSHVEGRGATAEAFTNPTNHTGISDRPTPLGGATMSLTSAVV